MCSNLVCFLLLTMLAAGVNSFMRATRAAPLARGLSRGLSMSAEGDLTELVSKYIAMGVGGKQPSQISDLFTDDALFIRPTGNPMSMGMYKEMLSNADVNIDSNELLSIDRMDISGDMAYVMFTAHGKFTFKGTPNDDVAVFTMIAKKFGDSWKFAGGQRSTGRGPEEPKPDFTV